MSYLNRIMQTVIVLLPALLYLGVAAQGIGLQLFVVMGLVWLWKTGHLNGTHQKALRQSGFILIGLWALGPLSNLVNAALTQMDVYAVVSEDKAWAAPLRSRVPSSVIITGALFVLASFTPSKSRSAPASEPLDANDAWLSLFFRATCLWTIVFTAFCLFQHLTGFDHRWEGGQLPHHFQLPDGRYRVRGFYGHPLSMAAVQLGYAFFFGTIALREWALRNARRKTGGTGRAITEVLAPCALTALLNLIVLSATGGRTALVVAVAGFPLLALFLFRRSVRPAALLAFLIPVSATIAWFALSSGTGRRLAEVAGGNIERFTFWRVHLDIWLSNPVLGRGPALLSEGLTKSFYEAAGKAQRMDFPNAHNLFVQTLADVGVVGFVLSAGGLVVLLLILCSLGRASSNTTLTKRDPSRGDGDPTFEILQPAIWGLVAAFVANMAHGLTQNTYYDANVTVVYVGLLAFIVFLSLGRRHPQARQQPVATPPA